ANATLIEKQDRKTIKSFFRIDYFVSSIGLFVTVDDLSVVSLLIVIDLIFEGSKLPIPPGVLYTVPTPDFAEDKAVPESLRVAACCACITAERFSLKAFSKVSSSSSVEIFASGEIAIIRLLSSSILSNPAYSKTTSSFSSLADNINPGKPCNFHGPYGI